MSPVRFPWKQYPAAWKERKNPAHSILPANHELHFVLRMRTTAPPAGLKKSRCTLASWVACARAHSGHRAALARMRLPSARAAGASVWKRRPRSRLLRVEFPRTPGRPRREDDRRVIRLRAAGHHEAPRRYGPPLAQVPALSPPLGEWSLWDSRPPPSCPE